MYISIYAYIIHIKYHIHVITHIHMISSYNFIYVCIYIYIYVYPINCTRTSAASPPNSQKHHAGTSWRLGTRGTDLTESPPRVMFHARAMFGLGGEGLRKSLSEEFTRLAETIGWPKIP